MFRLSTIKSFIDKWGGYLRIVLVFAIFAFLILTIKPEKFGDAFSHADFKYIIIAVCMLIPNIGLQIFKWRYILILSGNKPTWKLTAYSLLGGFFLGAASPSRTGELARGFLMPGYSKVKIASLTVVDKGLTQMVIAFGGLFTLAFFLPFPLSILPILVILAAILMLVYIHKLRNILLPFLRKFFTEQQVENALYAFELLANRKIFFVAMISLIFYLTFLLQYFIVMRSFIDLPILTALKTLPLVYLANLALPISFGEYGIKEIVSYKLLEGYGIAGQFAVSATFVHNTIIFLIPSLIGGLMMIFRRR